MNIYLDSNIYEGCEKPMPEMSMPNYLMQVMDEEEMQDFYWKIEQWEDYLKTLPTLEISGSVPANWKEGDDVTGKYKKQHQTIYANGWEDCGEPYYNLNNNRNRRIVALPLPSEPLRADEKTQVLRHDTSEMLDNIEQNLIESIADFLDTDSIKLDQAIALISDPVEREESELHIRMAKAAMNEYKKTMLPADEKEERKEGITESDFIPFVIYLTGYKEEQAVRIYENWKRNIKMHR